MQVYKPFSHASVAFPRQFAALYLATGRRLTQNADSRNGLSGAFGIQPSWILKKSAGFPQLSVQ